MSVANLLSYRHRAHSQVSLRKKIIRSASEDKNNQLKKSSTAVSFRPKLERLIQEGKIEQILNSDPHSKANLFYTTHVNQMEKELMSTKKSLSSLVMKTKVKENSINKIKNQITRAERQIDILRQESVLISKKFSGTTQQFSKRKQQAETIAWSERSYVNIKERGGKDQTFLKARYQKLQEAFKRESEEYKILDQKYLELKQINKELMTVVNEAKDISKFQTDEKNQFIDLLNQEITEKEMLEELKADKYKKENQINGIATSLIEKEELERIMEIFYTHKILSQIIKIKSSNLLARYDHVQKSYTHIKSNSNIFEPDKILKRMEEHDKLYDNALKRAAILEKSLEKLEDDMQQSIHSKNEILSKEGQNQELSKGYYQGMERDKYELLLSEKEKSQAKSVNDEILKRKVQSWARKLYGHFSINETQNSLFFDCLTDLVVKVKQRN